MPATSVSTASADADVAAPEGDAEHGAERHHHADEHDQSSRLTARSSGERGWRNSRAVAGDPLRVAVARRPR